MEKQAFMLAKHELLFLPRNEYPAFPCSRCGYLMIGWAQMPEDLRAGGMLSRFATVLYQGTMISGAMLCCECQHYLRNTQMIASANLVTRHGEN